MFAVDDFALWFAWYFAGNLATQHPAAQQMAADARAAVIGAPLEVPRAEDPNGVLDWLTDRSAPPPKLSASTAPPLARPAPAAAR